MKAAERSFDLYPVNARCPCGREHIAHTLDASLAGQGAVVERLCDPCVEARHATLRRALPAPAVPAAPEPVTFRRARRIFGEDDE